MVNGRCIVATHLSKLPLRILWLLIATHLWDGGKGLNKLIPVIHKVHVVLTAYDVKDQDKMEEVCCVHISLT